MKDLSAKVTTAKSKIEKAKQLESFLRKLEKFDAIVPKEYRVSEQAYLSTVSSSAPRKAKDAA